MRFQRPGRADTAPDDPWPGDLDAGRAAHDVVARVEGGDRGGRETECFGLLEHIEVVAVAAGNVGLLAEPGLLMRWRQNDQPFALLAPVRRLAEQAGGLDALPFYLDLARDEPHAPGADGMTVWFTDLPSGPY